MTGILREKDVLKAFAHAETDWVTARQLQYLLEEHGIRASIKELIELAERLRAKDLLEVVFISPGFERTGFASKLTGKGLAKSSKFH